MVVCPWCGTIYDTFRSNCKNCGGPTQVASASSGAEDELLSPPPAPRAISNNYTLKLMLTDAQSITGLVLGIVGGVFTLTGLVLTALLVTVVIGVPFLLFGALIFIIGGGLLYVRYQEKQKVVHVLKNGQAVRGEITGVEENLMVRVNHRHPWIIEYQFRANGQVYSGSASTFRDPTTSAPEQFRPGRPAYVLYDPEAPERNALYPHP